MQLASTNSAFKMGRRTKTRRNLRRRRQWCGLNCRLFCLLVCFCGLIVAVRAETINWGPFHGNLGLQAGFEYQDNYRSSSTNPQDDLTLSCGPTFNGGITLPIRTPSGEEQMTLSVGTSISYRYSLLGRSGQNSFNSPVNVALTAPFSLGSWMIFASDNFSFTDDPLESAVAVGQSRSDQMQNTAALTGTRQFGRFALSLAVQRQDKFSAQNPETEETDYTFSVTPSLFLQKTFSVFWSNSVGFIFPSDAATAVRSQGINLTSMVGISGEITPAISGSLGVGFQHSQFDAYNTPTKHIPAQGTDGPTANIGLNYAHPLRPNTTHSLSMFYTPGVTAMMNQSNYQTSYGANYSISHRLNREITLSPNLNWTHTEDASSGGSGEAYDMISAGLGLSRSFGQHLTGTFQYRYQTRSSTLAASSYDCNIISVNFSYTF